MHSAAKSGNNIVTERERQRQRERDIKAVEKDLSATIVASIHSIGATVVGKVRLNFGGKGGDYGLPHFHYCLVAKWILQFYSDLLFALAAK